MQRLLSELFKIEFSQSMIASVVSKSDTELLVTAKFRAYSDFGALEFYSKEPNQHSQFAYPENTDYSGTSLSFIYIPSGYMAGYSDIVLRPALTVMAENTAYYVSLGFCGEIHSGSASFTYIEDFSIDHNWIEPGSEVLEYSGVDLDTEATVSGTAVRGQDYDIDNVKGIIHVMEGSIPYAANVSMTYSYHGSTTYTLDFDHLYQGETVETMTSVPSTGITKVMLPIISSLYAKGQDTFTGRSDLGTAIFSDWTVSGGEIGEPKFALRESPYRFCDGYDDEYYQNPKRLIKCMVHLGYREAIDMYIGASHYYDFAGTAGTEISLDNENMITDADMGMNDASYVWLYWFAYYAKQAGFTKFVWSISMESLHVPAQWRQKMYDGTDGGSGWTPATHFYSPTNPEVRAWYLKTCKNCLDISQSVGFTPILQLGEPWWWWQEFIPGDVKTPMEGRPPCFYDEYTKIKFKSDMGYDLPLFSSSDINTTTYRSVLEWLRDRLGDFSNYIKSIAESYSGGEYTILLFPPSVIDTNRAPEAIRIVNFPKDNWKYPNLDFIQIEDYDWVIQENDNHQLIYSFAQDYLGYPVSQIEYFSGFCWINYLIQKTEQSKMKDEDYMTMLSTDEGQIDIKPDESSYIKIMTTIGSPYNAVCLRSETYTAGDIIYIVNGGDAGMAINYIDSSWSIPTLISWMNPTAIVKLKYNGWDASTMWSSSFESEIGFDGKIIKITETIPFDYQWGLIENAARWGRKTGFKNVYIWAGTQIRRDSFIPAIMFQKVQNMYVEMKENIYHVTPYVEEDNQIYPIKEVWEECNWHKTGKYK